jgi:hypothetical protein
VWLCCPCQQQERTQLSTSLEQERSGNTAERERLQQAAAAAQQAAATLQTQVWARLQFQQQLTACALRLPSADVARADDCPAPCVLRCCTQQLAAAHADHKALRDQYAAEIVAHNGDLEALEAAEKKVAALQEQLNKAQARVFLQLACLQA